MAADLLPGAAPQRPAGQRRQRGASAIELALALPIFLFFIFGLLEFARLIYLSNTVAEITRRAARAAAVSDFSQPARLAAIRQDAVFRASAGALPLGGAITDSYVRIDYLWQDADGVLQALAVLPASPAANVRNCAIDPHSANCIRFVRARLCLPDTDCDPVPYEALLPLLDPVFKLNGVALMHLPPSTTLVRAEALGFRPGMAP